MYSPDHFKINDQEVLIEFIQKYPFALMIGNDSNVSQIPVFLGTDNLLYGHFAKANEHSNHPDGSKITLLFQGPHAYISPLYYKSEFNVPTWNYATVHCVGKIHNIHNTNDAWGKMKEMVKTFEEPNGWDLPDEPRFKSLMNGIQFFFIEIITMEGKFKYSQNKSQEDVLSVIENLKKNNPEASSFMSNIHKV